MFEIGYLHKLIRDIPKPVIAAVNGVAMGGGHVLHVLCDVSIASETARFGQAGPRVGSFDAGFGSAYLARVVGEKKAREMWFWCRTYDAREALAMGPGQRCRPSRPAARRGQGVGGGDRRRRARRRSASSSSRSTPTPTTRPGCQQPGDDRAGPVHRLARGAGGRGGVRREARARLRPPRRLALRPWTSAPTTASSGGLPPGAPAATRPASAPADRPELRREIGRRAIGAELPSARRAGVDRLRGIVTEEIGRGDVNVAYLQVVGSLVDRSSPQRPSDALRWVPRICRRGDRRDRAHRAARGSDAGMPRSAVRTGTAGCSTAVSRCRSTRCGRRRSCSPAPAPSERARQGHQRVPRAARRCAASRREPVAGHGHRGRRARPRAPATTSGSPATT